jgi:MYXO-CTERM domain-containing protein
MKKPRVLTLAVGVVLLLTVASSARADSVRVPPGLDKLNLVDGQVLSFPETGKVELNELLSEHFANNNGKHLGFSVASFHGGVKFGLANPRNPSTSVTQNPEPTGMLLLGTGLAAAAALARRRVRRRRL